MLTIRSPPSDQMRIGHIWIVALSARAMPYWPLPPESFATSSYNSFIVFGGASMPAAFRRVLTTK